LSSFAQAVATPVIADHRRVGEWSAKATSGMVAVMDMAKGLARTDRTDVLECP
jgi:hypothetical protein